MCKTKDLWEIVMSSEKNNILELNQYMKSYKLLYIIYANMESFIKKIDWCSSNPENFSTTKLGSIFLADIQYQQFEHW